MSEEIVTVTELVERAIDGDKNPVIVIHSHPFIEKQYGYKTGTTLGHCIEDAKLCIPSELIDRVVSWNDVRKYFEYDERFSSTVSFTIFTHRWTIFHLWTSSESNCGGQIVKFLRMPKSLTNINPIKKRFHL